MVDFVTLRGYFLRTQKQAKTQQQKSPNDSLFKKCTSSFRVVLFSPASASRPAGRHGGLERATKTGKQLQTRATGVSDVYDNSPTLAAGRSVLKWTLDGKLSAGASACSGSCGQSPAPPRPLQDGTSDPEPWNPTDLFVFTHVLSCIQHFCELA